jgi:exopolysaccharide biosynthesis polyprenyl glycosylphosphotransferase
VSVLDPTTSGSAEDPAPSEVAETAELTLAASAAEAPIVMVPEAPGTALPGFRRLAAALVLMDASSVLVGLLSVHTLGVGAVGKGEGFLLVLAISPLVWVAIFHSFGLYGIRHLSAPEEFRRVISATTLGVLVIMVGSVWWRESLDRRSLALTWLVTLLLELVVRRVTRWHMGKGKASGELALRTLIVGTNEEAASIADALSEPVRGFLPVGFIVTAPRGSAPQGLPVMGSLEDLPDAIGRTSAECVFIASTAVSAGDVYQVSRCCRRANIEMRVSANTREVLTSRVSVHQVHDLMVLAVRSAKLTPSQALVKRSFDLVVSSLGLILCTPLMGAIAVAVKLTSPGPVLFRQERVTKDGRSFTVLKFRSMFTDPTVVDISQPFFKLRADPRMTKVGRILRSWSLDELPQLWNVIRGDMSLVGPRPLAVEQVASNLSLLDSRHEVRAGLTGWWQVNGRSELEAEDALKMDLFYIENWSLALDLYLVLKTIGVVLTRKGAY